MASAAVVVTVMITYICRAQLTALYQNAAVPALLLLAISELSMVVLLAKEGSGRGL